MVKKLFKRIYIEISNICNLNCSFCKKTKRPLREMSSLEFEKVLSSVKDYTDYIYLHVKGEPLAHSEIDNILTICDKSGIKVNITTNGTLLKKNLEILKKHSSVRQLNISLHSMENPANAEPYVDNIISCVNVLNDYFMISLRIWTYDNKNNTNDILINKLEKKYNVKIDFNNPRSKISDNIFFSLGETFRWPSTEDCVKSETGYCLGTRSQLAVLSDGTVVPCCLDAEGSVNLGNLFFSSLDEILNSDRFIKMNKSLENRVLTEDLCKKCTYRTRFDKK